MLPSGIWNGESLALVRIMTSSVTHVQAQKRTVCLRSALFTRAGRTQRLKTDGDLATGITLTTRRRLPNMSTGVILIPSNRHELRDWRRMPDAPQAVCQGLAPRTRCRGGNRSGFNSWPRQMKCARRQTACRGHAVHRGYPNLRRKRAGNHVSRQSAPDSWFPILLPIASSQPERSLGSTVGMR